MGLSQRVVPGTGKSRKPRQRDANTGEDAAAEGPDELLSTRVETTALPRGEEGTWALPHAQR